MELLEELRKWRRVLGAWWCLSLAFFVGVVFFGDALHMSRVDVARWGVFIVVAGGVAGARLMRLQRLGFGESNANTKDHGGRDKDE